jgi:CO/xanthine dehydrogenase Mo-binding subunit
LLGRQRCHTGIRGGLQATPEAAAIQATANHNVVEVEIDPDTGVVTIERYTVVDDFGRTINPLLLEGTSPWRDRAGHRPSASRKRGL